MSQRRTLWEEGREPGRQVVALGVALALTAVVLDLALSGSVGLLFDVVFVLGCVAMALAVRPSDFFTVGVLPPLLMTGIFVLVGITRPDAIDCPPPVAGETRRGFQLDDERREFRATRVVDRHTSQQRHGVLPGGVVERVGRLDGKVRSRFASRALGIFVRASRRGRAAVLHLSNLSFKTSEHRHLPTNT